MGERPLLSLIVPSYNETEDVLRRCLESALLGGDDDLEILVVDDGSETFPEEETLLFGLPRAGAVRILHQKNTGVSGARNRALREARGRWIAFADADDALAEGYMAALRPLLLLKDCDMLVFDVLREERGGDAGPVSVLPWHAGGLMNREEARHLLLDTVAGGYRRKTRMGLGAVWNKVFRAELISGAALTFPEEMYVAEDCVFVIRALTGGADRIRYLREPLYIRAVRPGSAMHRYQDTIRANDRIFLREIRRALGSTAGNPALREAMTKRVALCALGVLGFDTLHPDKPASDGERIREMRDVFSRKPYAGPVRRARLRDFRKAERVRLLLLRLRAYRLLLALERRALT